MKKIISSVLVTSVALHATALSFIITTLISAVYITIEPSTAMAVSTSDDVLVTLSVDESISITSPSDATMAPNISAAVSTSTGTTTWNIKTNAITGYTLYLKNASTSPAMKGTASLYGVSNFADYTEATGGVPEVFGADSNSYQFGYSAFGNQVSTAYGTGTHCGSGVIPTTLKYRHASTTNIIVATSTATTTTSGVDTTVCWAAVQNGVYAPAGTYRAEITATASTN